MIKPSTPSTLEAALQEEQLVAEIRHNPAAFVELYDRYLAPVYRYLVSRVGDPQDAEDLTSQVFLTALERFPQYQNQGKPFAAWLFTIARNKSIDFFRARRIEDPLTSFHSSEDQKDPLSEVVQKDESQTILDIIATYPPQDREVLQLRFAAEMTYAEIAHLLQRNEDAVKKQIYRLLERIGKDLEDKNGQPA